MCIDKSENVTVGEARSVVCGQLSVSVTGRVSMIAWSDSDSVAFGISSISWPCPEENDVVMGYY